MPTIELSNEDTEKFKLFCKYFDDFEVLLKAGVFQTKNGSDTIHRNQKGEIMVVEKKFIAFKKNVDTN